MLNFYFKISEKTEQQLEMFENCYEISTTEIILLIVNEFSGMPRKGSVFFSSDHSRVKDQKSYIHD